MSKDTENALDFRESEPWFLADNPRQVKTWTQRDHETPN